MEQYKGNPLNQMLAAESEEFYGGQMTDEHLKLIEDTLNEKLCELQISGIYIKVDRYDENTFSVTPIIGEREIHTPAIMEEQKLEDWWT